MSDGKTTLPAQLRQLSGQDKAALIRAAVEGFSAKANELGWTLEDTPDGLMWRDPHQPWILMRLTVSMEFAGLDRRPDDHILPTGGEHRD